jgi:hypothetical protein
MSAESVSESEKKFCGSESQKKVFGSARLGTPHRVVAPPTPKRCDSMRLGSTGTVVLEQCSIKLKMPQPLATDLS